MAKDKNTIAVKTTIISWMVVGEKERIVFDKLDFSPDQVSQIDRLIRHNDQDKARLTIEPVQKQLQFKPIEAIVRIVNMNCTNGGQKIKIADFISSDESARALKAMVAAATQVMVTIEQIQEHLFEEGDSHQPSGISSEPKQVTGYPECPETITVKLPKTYNCECRITIAKDGDGYSGNFYLKIGNYQTTETSEIWGTTQRQALQDAKNDIFESIDNHGHKNEKQLKKKIEKAIDEWVFENC